jgi:hypothetical protein
MAILAKSTAYKRAFLMVQSSDHITGLTGATVTVTISKAGASFGAIGGSVTEIGNGWYYVNYNTTDTGTVGDLAAHCTATSGDPTDFVDQVADTTVGTLGVVVVTNSDKTGYTASTVSDKTGYALTSGERNSVADAMLDRDMSTGADNGSTTVRTVRQALRFLRNKWAISGSTLTVYKEDDTTSSWTSALTTTAGANPVTTSDPAG